MESLEESCKVCAEYGLLQMCGSVLGSGTSLTLLPLGKMAEWIVDTVLSATDDTEVKCVCRDQ